MVFIIKIIYISKNINLLFKINQKTQGYFSFHFLVNILAKFELICNQIIHKNKILNFMFKLFIY